MSRSSEGFSRVSKETLKAEMTQKYSKPPVNWPENLHFQGWFLRKMPSIQSSEAVKCEVPKPEIRHPEVLNCGYKSLLLFVVL